MTAEITIMTIIIITRNTALLKEKLIDFCSFDAFPPEHCEKKSFWHGHTAKSYCKSIPIIFIYSKKRYFILLCCYLLTGWHTQHNLSYLWKSHNKFIKSLILRCQCHTTSNNNKIKIIIKIIIKIKNNQTLLANNTNPHNSS